MEKYWQNPFGEVGCDEAGRGCLAGPVVAAAVILNTEIDIPGIDDSKKLSSQKRETLRLEIEQKSLAYAVAFVYPEEIDKINILQASFLAMHRALDQIQTPFTQILIDGNRFNKYRNFTHTCIVAGDSKYMSIAAASILAKTYRDDYMLDIHTEFPIFQWNKNKGYPTEKHRKAIEKYGICCYHRKTFGNNHLQNQLSLPF